MKLKLYIIDQLAGILQSGVSISKMEDKKAKRDLMDDYIALRKLCKVALEDREEIIRKFQTDWGDELAEVEALRKTGKVEGHEAYLQAEKDAQEALTDLFAREVEVDIIPVKKEAVADFFVGNLEQWAVLLDNGIIIDE